MKSEDYRAIERELGGVRITIMTYKIGDQFYCHIANADPGATIARAEAATREEAERIALAKASVRLKVPASK